MPGTQTDRPLNSFCVRVCLILAKQELTSFVMYTLRCVVLVVVAVLAVILAML